MLLLGRVLLAKTRSVWRVNKASPWARRRRLASPKEADPEGCRQARLNALAKNLEDELKDADLFAPLPPTEDCAICLVPLPHVKISEVGYVVCCGKEICWACYKKEHEESINKQNEENFGKKVALTCPFCRSASDEEFCACFKQGVCKMTPLLFYNDGRSSPECEHDLPKDDLKALDCYIRAVGLGFLL